MDKHWRIFIDWDNDGVCESAEHVRTFDYQARRGRDRMLRNTGDGFEPQRIGRAVLMLDNDDRRFDPLYTSSPLYGKVAPQRKVQIGVENGGGLDFLLLESGDKIIQENGIGLFSADGTGTYYPRFTGQIDDIQPDNSRGRRSVKLAILDNWRKLRDETGVWIDLVSDTTTKAAIEAILDEISWPDADRDLTGDGDTIDYYWTEGVNADAEIWNLVHSNLGQVFMSFDGKLTFTDRQTLYNTTENATITETVLHKDIRTPYEWRQIKNKVRVIAHPVVEQSAIEMWRLIDIPLVKNGSTTTLWADLTYDNRPVVVSSLTTPAATTDYTMNSAADGSGTNLTADFTVTASTLGRVVKLEVENTGATDGYITLLKLRGDAIDTPNLTAVESEDTDSVYAKSTMTLDLLWQQSTDTAQDFADWLISWLNEPLIFPFVRMEDQDAKQLGNDLFTRVRADLDTLEIDTDFYIGSISERWTAPTGQGLETGWYLEPIDMTTYWEFTTSMGVSSRFAY